jgi:hypothetical protein
MAQPTAQEQYMLELINRARANPNTEAARLGIGLNDRLPAGTISSTAKQPLAFNERLMASARGHSAWMISANQFSHTGAGGSDSQTRMLQAGYVFTGGGRSGENLAWQGSGGPVNATAFIAEEHDMLVESEGHRANIFGDSYKEIGIGALTGVFQGLNSLVTTQNFANAAAGPVFLTGVVFNDAVINDDFYTVGEGLANVRVDAVSATGQRLRTVGYGSGGYSLAAAPGTYSVFFSGGALGSQVVRKQAAIASQNVKLDLEFGPNSAPQTTFDLLQYSASNRDLAQVFGVNTDGLLDHYLSSGMREGRSLDSFDEVRYLASNADLISAFGYNPAAATQHYIQHGAREGRSLTAFDGYRYLASNRDLIGVLGLNLDVAVWHYVSYGHTEGRATDTFDGIRYLASNKGLIDVFGKNSAAATLHYVTYGAREGRATQSFDPAGYLSRNTDLRPIFGNDFFAATNHYVEYGYREGRV